MGKAAAGGGFAVVVVVCMPGAARRRELVGRNIVPGTRSGRKRHQAVSLSPSRRGRLRESVCKGGAGGGSRCSGDFAVAEERVHDRFDLFERLDLGSMADKD